MIAVYHLTVLLASATHLRPSCVLEQLELKTSDGFPIGFWKQDAPKENTPLVLILPGYSMTGLQFMTWFGAQLNTVGYDVVAMDYRGFGISKGSLGAEISPTSAVYKGLRASRFAADAHELIIHLSTTHQRHANPVILGHSYGCAVATAMISLWNPKLSGLILLDQPPRPMGLANYSSDPSYSQIVTTSVFDPSAMEAQIRSLSEFHQRPQLVVQRSPYPDRFFFYPFVASFWGQTFKSIEGLRRQNKTEGGCVCYSDACLLEWAKGTDYWSQQNGQVVALTIMDDMMSDYTDAYDLVSSASYPVFVYGGKYSLNEMENMQWVWDTVHDRRADRSVGRLDRLLLFEDEFGVHAPWLNPQPSRQHFYGNLTNWLSELEQAPPS